MYTYFYSANAAKKSSFYNNPEFDALVTKARQSTDESERADLYKQADNILTRTDYATLPLYYPKYQFVAKDYVKNAKVGNLIYHMMDVDIDTTKSDYTARSNLRQRRFRRPGARASGRLFGTPATDGGVLAGRSCDLAHRRERADEKLPHKKDSPSHRRDPMHFRNHVLRPQHRAGRSGARDDGRHG